ncbi:iron-sulfur cluster assembly 1 homolog, mitochondrial isoform X8 [Canis lupus dingo]|uniref:iron-sulfur cluster assembly 1 homolog, mitochondrial isoform X1 n=1 Tax=Canis lupus familiaris TaxID=9615 RepID=UPI0018F6A01F|nr:iron-sulfur cluster assembly 1 homolog, mitochondrial isoform X1 [Canis lupus familiaris]XP_048972050.1 iron-sulfur cluster assembly 1 homolog, mitochondrial isoform X8 [Canis lupus dingo]
MKVSNKDFLELQCRTVLSDGIKRLLSRTVPLFGFYLWESGSFLLGFHPIGQVLLPPPSKPESSRDLPWSLHQCVYEPGAEGRSRGGENLKRTLSMEPNRTRDCDLGHNQKSDT